VVGRCLRLRAQDLLDAAKNSREIYSHN
jgi:hypothetical protein